MGRKNAKKSSALTLTPLPLPPPPPPPPLLAPPSLVELPSHLLEDIFFRLPIKALVQLRSVCKRLNLLISDEKFKKNQLSFSRFQVHIIRCESKLRIETLPMECMLNFSPIKPNNTSTFHFPPFKKGITIMDAFTVGCCHGIMCIVLSFFTTPDSSPSKFGEGILVFNPITRKYKELPLPFKKVENNWEGPTKKCYGFGYDSISKLYKVLVVFKGVSQVKILTLGTAESEWRNIGSFSFGFPDHVGTFWNGKVYWLSSSDKYRSHYESDDDHPIVKCFLVCFDLTKETFKAIDGPDYGKTIPQRKLYLSVQKNSLCLLADHDIWLMEESGNWTKWHTIPSLLSNPSITPYEFGKLLHISEDDEVLLSALALSGLNGKIAFGRKYGFGYEEEVEIGKGQRSSSRLQGLLNEAQALLTEFYFSDHFPLMGWVDRLRGTLWRLDRTFKELDLIYQRIIQDHMDHSARTNSNEQEAADIIDIFLRLMNNPSSLSFDLKVDNIKAVLMNIFIAGTDTSAAIIVWAMTALLNNPRVMNKVQGEIRELFGDKDFINEEEIERLPYLKAVVKETLRLFPTSPLLLPRETMEKCNIEGYEIQPKTLVYVNAWAIARDPETWKDPEEFYPERFIESNTSIDFKGTDFELIPFGAGRRMCPAMHMGVVTIELSLANLLHSFDWELPRGVDKELMLGTQVKPGITMHKKIDLHLVPRKHTHTHTQPS